MTLADHVTAAAARLVEAGIPSAEASLDARLLARHVLGWEAARLAGAMRDPEPPGFGPPFAAMIERRERREPLAYITGQREFWGLPFEVSRDVLIPRPETELIIETTLELIPDRKALRLAADVGTGSGCLAIALSVEYPQLSIVATDTSRAALAVASRNVERHASGRVRVTAADMLPASTETFDLIVSNPPYVPTTDLKMLQPEVRDYEPHSALFGGSDGLDVVRRLLTVAPASLASSGLLLFEFGFGQSAAVAELISRTAGLTMVGLREDLQRIPRVAVARRT